MITFNPGQVVEVKDFNRRDPEFSLGPFIVERRSEEFVYLLDESNESIRLKIHNAGRYEWLFHSPHFMICPAGAGAF